MLLRSRVREARLSSWVDPREATADGAAATDGPLGAALAWPAAVPTTAAAAQPPAPLATLHDDVIERVLGALSPQELLAASLVCTRLRDLGYSDTHWARHYATRWGAPPVAIAARALCGSWRALYSSKAANEAEAAPWKRPCEWELQAALGAMIGDATAAAKAAPSAAAPATAPARSAAVAAAPAGDEETVVEEEGTTAATADGAVGQSLSVVFLLDGSGSVGEDDFDSMASFVTTAAATFTRACPGTQAAVLQFSNAARVEVGLGPADRTAFTTAVAAMARMNGGTNIAAALAQAGAVLRAGAPPGGARLVVLLTDGRVDGYQMREAKAMASRLADEQAGVVIWALGVGRGVDRRELVSILEGATCPGGAAESRYLDLSVRDDVPW